MRNHDNTQTGLVAPEQLRVLHRDQALADQTHLDVQDRSAPLLLFELLFDALPVEEPRLPGALAARAENYLAASLVVVIARAA